MYSYGGKKFLKEQGLPCQQVGTCGYEGADEGTGKKAEVFSWLTFCCPWLSMEQGYDQVLRLFQQPLS